MRHTNTDVCTRCEAILKDAHPDLQAFAAEVRREHPDAHVSWSYRGEKDQNAAFASGVSKARFGESPHNYRPALAIDWFRLTHTGAEWKANWFMDVIVPAARAAGLVSGADFPKFRDLPHVELKDWRSYTR